MKMIIVTTVEEYKSKVFKLFKKAGVDTASIGTHQDYVKPLMTLFKKRG